MKSAKVKKTPNQNRREFLAKLGIGTAAVAGFSSCELSDINFIGKLKEGSKANPEDKDIYNLVEALQLNENIEKTIVRLKKNVYAFKKIPAGMDELFSDKEIKKLLEEEVQYYVNYYKTHFTAGEIRELVKILNSKVWQKYTLKNQEMNAVTLVGENPKPSIKFVSKVNSLLSKRAVTGEPI